jgi:UDP-N-acetylglucosamine pyrophosphorylase
MLNVGVAPTNIRCFIRLFKILESGDQGFIYEKDVAPVTDLPKLSEIQKSNVTGSGGTSSPNGSNASALSKTVVIKLNGGLGTSMGLTRAKTLLELAPGINFLDVIVQRIFQLRTQNQVKLPLIFMNSFNTSADTREYLQKYPELFDTTINNNFAATVTAATTSISATQNDAAHSSATQTNATKTSATLPAATPTVTTSTSAATITATPNGLPWEFLQSQEPKLNAKNFFPVEFSPDPKLEWCPPGHGDVYPTLFDTHLLDYLLMGGYEVAFISNSDNLAALPDPNIAQYFYDQGFGFLNELTPKTAEDVKGGHLVRRKSDQRLLLREFSQITPEDHERALDPEVHPYCNTNNIWVNLPQLKKALDRTQGVLELPLIRNLKNVDPKDSTTAPVIQLETAMGAACSAFSNSSAIEVPRSRFRPVKNTVDFERLQSQLDQVLDGIERR